MTPETLDRANELRSQIETARHRVAGAERDLRYIKEAKKKHGDDVTWRPEIALWPGDYYNPAPKLHVTVPIWAVEQEYRSRLALAKCDLAQAEYQLAMLK